MPPTYQSWGSTGWTQDPKNPDQMKKVATPSTYGVGIGAPYSAGTGGQVMTDADRAWYTEQTGMNSPQAVFGLGITDPTRNPLAAGPSGMNRYDLYNQGLAARQGTLPQFNEQMGFAPAGSSSGSSSSIRFGGGGAGSAMPTWSRLFRDDAIARINRAADTQLDAETDAYENAGLGTIGGGLNSAKQAVNDSRNQAIRGAEADDERLAQEYALRWWEADQRAKDREAQLNAAQWSSIADAAGRLGSGANSGSRSGGSSRGTDSGSLTGNVFGVNFADPGENRVGSLPAKQRPNIQDRIEVSNSELVEMMSSPSRYGFTYKELYNEYLNRLPEGTPDPTIG